MSSKAFLIPVTAAIAALTSGQASAATTQNEIISTTDEAGIPASLKASDDKAAGKILYQVGTEEHALVLKNSAMGTVYAQHGSHGSHGSHSSHSSGR